MFYSECPAQWAVDVGYVTLARDGILFVTYSTLFERHNEKPNHKRVREHSKNNTIRPGSQSNSSAKSGNLPESTAAIVVRRRQETVFERPCIFQISREQKHDFLLKRYNYTLGFTNTPTHILYEPYSIDLNNIRPWNRETFHFLLIIKNPFLEYNIGAQYFKCYLEPDFCCDSSHYYCEERLICIIH